MSREGWELCWSPKFEATGRPDEQTWVYDLGHGHNGWGNRELQHYEKGEHVCSFQDGRLVITGVRNASPDEPYSSARIHTSGKASWQYGRFAFRARLPRGQGTWAAIWMLSDKFGNGTRWPLCGEIDIMEYVGRDPERVHFSLHSDAYNHTIGTQVTESHVIPGIADGFHDYAMEWDETGFSFFIDDNLLSRFEKGDKQGEAEWPFDQPFHLVLNLALGGYMGGELDPHALPATFEIEEIKVYQKEPAGVHN